MRIAPWVAAALCAASAAIGGQDVIEWSSGRRLAPQDFKGRVPAIDGRTSLSWLHIDVSWQCDGNRLEASARATFDPARSWWRPAQGNIWEGVAERAGEASRAQLEARRSVAQRDLQLLDHEQLHFDIAELAARRIRKHFEDVKGTCAEPGGAAGLQAYVADVDRELQEDQSRYDRETNNGVNAAAQEKWRRTIRPQLGLPAR